jgi:uncharacterized protein (DUF1697 family)
MPRYVALLGSINVGGNSVRMAELRTALDDAGFENVATAAASGNVLFDHVDAAGPALARSVARVLKDTFGIRSFAAVRSMCELEEALADNPFAEAGEEKFVHVGFLDGKLSGPGFEKLRMDHGGKERIAPGRREIFIDYVDGVGRSKLTNAFIEKRIERSVTMRNMRSIRRVLEKMD